MITVCIRVDASTSIGTGHVVRCLTLASALRDRGHAIHFVCREHPGHLCELIANEGFAVTRLAVEAGANSATNAAPLAQVCSLGASWEADAAQTARSISLLRSRRTWLIVDHYEVDRRWEASLRQVTERIMVIDDLANREHDCDLLLDQNLVPKLSQRYEGKVPARCVSLLGPKFALLQNIYRELYPQAARRRGVIRRILVFFGGADNQNITGRAISAFLKLGRSDIRLDVVVTQTMMHRSAVQAQVYGRENIELHAGLPTLAHLMKRADLAIGASGATSWERLCLGLPAIVITIADNQRPVAAELDRLGLIRWLGDAVEVDTTILCSALARILEDDSYERWSADCLKWVDGKGAQRVCASLTLDSQSAFVVREAGVLDEQLLLDWANDPAVRSNAFSSDPIDAKSHHRWFSARLDRPDSCVIYIVETEDGVPIGQVRFERSEADWTIDYALGAEFRGRGCGKTLLHVALLKLAQIHPGASVRGQVKIGNAASHRVFESLQFMVHRQSSDVVEYSLVV